jgi:succinyl-CoA synthetase alpha subunit
MIGEIGGTQRNSLQSISRNTSPKPVVSYIAGKTAQPASAWGMQALYLGQHGDAESKIRAPQRVGVPVATMPHEVPQLLRDLL